MDNLLPQFDNFKDRIPEFVIKIYHILQDQTFNDYFAWNGDSEIVIKNPKKLEEKVLPHFFRHRHLSSFIRQLNMYKFSKVNKLTKERNHMYFKNEHFRRNQIEQLTKIKRNNKKNRQQQCEQQNSEASIENKQDFKNSSKVIDSKSNVSSYKEYTQNIIREVVLQLKKIEGNRPEIKSEIADAISKCNELLETPAQNFCYPFFQYEDALTNKNMLSTMKFLPMEPMLFSSQCSFFHLSQIP